MGGGGSIAEAQPRGFIPGNLGQFPDEVLANLATPYFISTRSDKRGWGLGLPIVKALSESFGGEARFANGAGEVVITLHLPLRLA